MSSPPLRWKQQLAGQMDPGWASEIDDFESQLQLRGQGKIGRASCRERV